MELFLQPRVQNGVFPGLQQETGKEIVSRSKWVRKSQPGNLIAFATL